MEVLKMGINSIDAEDDQFAYRYDTQLLIDRRDKDLDEDEIADYITEHLEGKKEWFNGELPVTQFGTIEYLAPALFNKKSTVQVTFNPATGGLIKVDREEGE